MIKFFTICFLFATLVSNAQNVGIGTKNPLSKLHVAGTLRVDSLANQKTSGLVLHDKDGVIFSLKLTGNKSDVLRGDGTFSSNSTLATGPTWLTTGNAGVDESTNFLGTTDLKALFFRVNNIKAGMINPRTGNISLGMRALALNTRYSNIAIGTDALKLNTGAHNTIAIGDSALFNQTGMPEDYFDGPTANIAIGSKALYSNIGGSDLVAIGQFALQKNNNMGNTAVGTRALRNNTGNANSAFGTGALQGGDGIFNTALGYNTLHYGGNHNTAVGMNAMVATTGTGNVAIGEASMAGEAAIAGGGVVTSSNYNTAVGYHTMSILYHTGSTVLGGYNVAVGANALQNNDKGTNNVAVGYLALNQNINGRSLVAVGDSALYNQINNASSLYGSTAIGSRSMLKNTTGYRNTGVGYQSLFTNTTGGGNTALGNGADVTVGNLSNATAIGFSAKVNASNKVRIGNSAVTKIEGQVPFTIPSDGRYKYNVREDVKGLSFILRLRPVTYQFDVKRFDIANGTDINVPAMQVGYTKAEALRRTGFIAQEVEKAADATGYNFSGVNKPETEKEHYSLSYESFVVPLVKAVQEQQVMISTLQDQIRIQQEQINMLLKEAQENKKK